MDRSFEIRTSDGSIYLRNRVSMNSSKSDHSLNPSIEHSTKFNNDDRYHSLPVEQSVSKLPNIII